MNEQAVLVELEDAPDGEGDEPLEIVVTNAGNITTRLYTLLRKAVPILEDPESVPAPFRQTIADAIRIELDESEEDGDEMEPALCFGREPERRL